MCVCVYVCAYTMKAPKVKLGNVTLEGVFLGAFGISVRIVRKEGKGGFLSAILKQDF